MTTHQQSYLRTDDEQTTLELWLLYADGAYRAVLLNYLTEQVDDNISRITEREVLGVEVTVQPAPRFHYQTWRKFITEHRDQFVTGDLDSRLTERVTQQAG